MEHLAYFLLLALLAEIIGTVGGFGSSLFFVPMASYFMDFYTVLGITALFHVSSNVSKIILFNKGVDKKLILSIGVPAVITVVLGAALTRFIPTQVLEVYLAWFLIAISLILLVAKNAVIKPTLSNSVSGGLLSGFVAGLLGTGGAIRGIVLVSFKLKTEVFIATSACIDLAIDSSRSIVYLMNGYVHKDDLYLIPALFIISIAGSYLGKKILTFISEEQFRSIVLVLILLTGLSMLARLVL